MRTPLSDAMKTRHDLWPEDAALVERVAERLGKARTLVLALQGRIQSLEDTVRKLRRDLQGGPPAPQGTYGPGAAVEFPDGTVGIVIEVAPCSHGAAYTVQCGTEKRFARPEDLNPFVV